MAAKADSALKAELDRKIEEEQFGTTAPSFEAHLAVSGGENFVGLMISEDKL